MILFFGFILEALALTGLILMERKDYWKSSLQSLHLPPDEGNEAARTAVGYFSAGKSLRNSILIIGGVLVASIIVLFLPLEFTWISPYAAAVVFGGMTLAIWSKIRKDLEALEEHKQDQISTLTRIKGTPENALSILGYPKLQPFGPKRVWVFKTFYDFHVEESVPDGVYQWPSGEYERRRDTAIAAMLPRLVDLATTVDSSKWFTLERSRLV